MKDDISIAEARDHLTKVVRRVERGRPVRLTRRGKPVAVLVSVSDFDRGHASRPSLWEAFQKWRRETPPECFVEPHEWLPPRDRSPGRDVRL
jgi:prevent-host-death family protein